LIFNQYNYIQILGGPGRGGGGGGGGGSGGGRGGEVEVCDVWGAFLPPSHAHHDACKNIQPAENMLVFDKTAKLIYLPLLSLYNF